MAVFLISALLQSHALLTLPSLKLLWTSSWNLSPLFDSHFSCSGVDSLPLVGFPPRKALNATKLVSFSISLLLLVLLVFQTTGGVFRLSFICFFLCRTSCTFFGGFFCGHALAVLLWALCQLSWQLGSFWINSDLLHSLSVVEQKFQNRQWHHPWACCSTSPCHDSRKWLQETELLLQVVVGERRTLEKIKHFSKIL